MASRGRPRSFPLRILDVGQTTTVRRMVAPRSFKPPSTSFRVARRTPPVEGSWPPPRAASPRGRRRCAPSLAPCTRAATTAQRRPRRWSHSSRTSSAASPRIRRTALHPIGSQTRRLCVKLARTQKASEIARLIQMWVYCQPDLYVRAMMKSATTGERPAVAFFIHRGQEEVPPGFEGPFLHRASGQIVYVRPSAIVRR